MLSFSRQKFTFHNYTSPLYAYREQCLSWICWSPKLLLKHVWSAYRHPKCYNPHSDTFFTCVCLHNSPYSADHRQPIVATIFTNSMWQSYPGIDRRYIHLSVCPQRRDVKNIDKICQNQERFSVSSALQLQESTYARGRQPAKLADDSLIFITIQAPSICATFVLHNFVVEPLAHSNTAYPRVITLVICVSFRASPPHQLSER